MGRMGRWLRNWLPQRRLRSWRYVSPRRHGAGVVLLLALVSGAYVYWTQTNEAQIRRQARQYLAELTGGITKVAEARFTLFGGIKLKGVRVFIPGEDEPFFKAGVVVLRHRPWGLFVKRRLDVTGINCADAVLNLVHDARDNRWNYERLRLPADVGQAIGASAGAQRWPPLVVRKARVLVTEQDGGVRLQKNELNVNISGLVRGKDLYQFTLEEEGEDGKFDIFGTVAVNLATGETLTHGQIKRLGKLPAALLERFSFLKRLGISDDPPVTVSGRWDPRTGERLFEASLDNTSLQLPAELGGLSLHSVKGTLSFDANGLTVKDVSGRVLQAGDARFTVSGRYGGYEANSPFDIRVDMQGLEAPRQLQAAGDIERFLDYFNRRYRIDGKLDVWARLRRDASGEFRLVGTAEANGVTFVAEEFPYAIRDLRGQVFFTDEWLDIRRMRGAHGGARIEIDGLVYYPPEGRTYDILVKARDVAFDDDLTSALSGRIERVWRALRPRGRGGAQARISVDEPGQPTRVEVDLLLGGEASVEYEGFPYRLHKVHGEVSFSSDAAIVNSLTSKHGQTTFAVNGSVRWGAEANELVDLTIDARLPLDAKLAGALGPAGKAAFEAFRPSGMASRVRAKVWQRRGQDVQYKVSADVVNASFLFDQFPYEIADANGLLVFEPNRVTIQRLSGRHKGTPIEASGRVDYGSDRVGVELQVEAADVQLDEELFDAVPASVKRVWHRLAARGLSDVSFYLGWQTPDEPNGLDYLCEIRAKDVQLKYAAFPYLFRSVAGKAVVTPGRVELKDVTAREGKMRALLNGVITSDEKEDRAELAIRATDVPVSSDLLAALPAQAAPLLTRLKPGGTCSIDIPRLVLVSPSVAPASRPATQPATGAAAANPASRWRVEGGISLADAEIDLGVSARITGSLRGLAERTSEGVHIDANISLDSLVVHRRILTDVRARLTKKPASDITRIDDLLGKAYGGRLAGFAEIRAGDPFKYGFRIFAENMDLNTLFNAAVKDPNHRVSVAGLLDATIEYRAAGGTEPTRQATGVLRLSKAKVQRLPVLLNLLQPVFLSLPGNTAFREGAVTYSLKGDKLSFREIHLRGSGATIVGSGTMDLKTGALKLIFLSRPGLLPRLDNLADELLEGILRELVEIHVTGTLDKPRFRTIPLRSLDAIIQKLLRPE
ncbi:MAG TPA: hypothetical protein VNA25_16045 [Phycisphaerae bacterium]|nr:hypothetical protein [Phycisphaerae bacterium]HUT59361.1 hypothetical protein [Phycisphaerae bacterium]